MFKGGNKYEKPNHGPISATPFVAGLIKKTRNRQTTSVYA